MASGLDKGMPIPSARACLQTVLQIRYCQVTRLCLVRFLLFLVRYENGPKDCAENDVLVARFATDKARDLVVDWLEPFDIVAPLDTLNA